VLSTRSGASSATSDSAARPAVKKPFRNTRGSLGRGLRLSGLLRDKGIDVALRVGNPLER